MSFTYLSKEQVEEIIEPTCTDLCLFASYQPENEMTINHANIKYVTALAQCFQNVVLLTNTRTHGIDPWETTKFPDNVKLVQLENICYDFGMWFRVIANMNVSRLHRLALVNDSCTLLKPTALINIVKNTNAPFWGMTDSIEYNVHHIQSYFMVFQDQAITKLQNFVHESDIDGFEFGISKHMSSLEIPLFAIFPFREACKYKSQWNTMGYNSPHTMWDRLLNAGMPIIKKERQHYPDEDAFIARHHEKN